MPAKICILVTIHNRELFLPATIKSILKSTFCDFEVVLVDDMSTDNSLQIARDLASTDNRIRVVANSENLGDYGNRMKAASLAQSKYIKYVDSDDLIYPHSLQVMFDSMEQFPDAAAGLAHSMPEDDEPYPWQLTPEATYRKHFLGRGCLSCGPSGAIIRRDAFEAANGFCDEWGVLSDTEFWLRLATQHPIVLLPPGLVWWRRHEGQEFTKDEAAAVYLERGHQLCMQALSSEKCPLSEVDRTCALRKTKQHYARRLLALGTRHMCPGQAFRLYRKSQLSFTDLFRGIKRYQ
jgi:glycosyltransferase involved in cell wall biosynthesis